MARTTPQILSNRGQQPIPADVSSKESCIATVLADVDNIVEDYRNRWLEMSSAFLTQLKRQNLDTAIRFQLYTRTQVHCKVQFDVYIQGQSGMLITHAAARSSSSYSPLETYDIRLLTTIRRCMSHGSIPLVVGA